VTRRQAAALAVLVLVLVVAIVSTMRDGGVRRIARPAPPTAPETANGKKGVGAWYADGVDRSLADARVSWYYTWKSGTAGVKTPAGTEFVPMIWGPGNVTRDALDEARANGRVLLGFNEPDVVEQADMSVEQALDLWPQLMATGLRLGSPAPSEHADVPGGWLGRFLDGARARGHRVDFLALHWYGDGTTRGPAAVTELRRYLNAVHDRYHLPIWLTEYALVDFSAGSGSPRHPSDDEQAEFLTASTRMLDKLPFVERYAWFALATTGTQYETGLYDASARPTVLGDAYRDAG
jgi:hypothetical protein